MERYSDVTKVTWELIKEHTSAYAGPMPAQRRRRRAGIGPVFGQIIFIVRY